MNFTSPYEALSCLGDGERCGELGMFDWHRMLNASNIPMVLLLCAVGLAIHLSAVATSDGGRPVLPWLLRTNSWGFMWLPFIVEIVHHANAYVISLELGDPGFTPMGRMFHHVLDALCHTAYFVVMAACYRSNAGRGMPSRLGVIALFVARMAFLDHLDYGGISYRFKFDEPKNFERPESVLGYFAPVYHTTNPRTHCGKINWGYLVSVLGSQVLFVTGLGGLKGNLWPLLAVQGFLAEVPLFQPSFYMLGGGSDGTWERAIGMHLGHLMDYLLWQTNVFVWFFYGPNREWIEAYGEKKEREKSRRGTMETVDSISSGKED